MSTSATYYEETGYRIETVWLKKLLFTILTVYPFFLLISPVLYSGNIFAVLVVLISIVFYIIGCIRFSTLIIYFSITVAVIVQRIFLNTFSSIILLLNTAWIFLSEYIVELVIKEKTLSSREISLSSIIYAIQIALMSLTYVLIAVLIASTVNYMYEYVLSTAPRILQVFYAIFIETRVGAVLFTVLLLYSTFVFLNDYVYGLINDILFSTKKYVVDYANRFITEEYDNVINMNDWFGKFYRKIVFFIIVFTLFPIFYPLLEIMEFRATPLILINFLNLAISYILYYFINKYLRRIMSTELRLTIRNESLLLKIFISMLLIYIVFMILLSPTSSLDILATSISIKQPDPLRSDLFSKTISSIYNGFSETYYDISQKYVLYLNKSYSVFLEIIDKLIKFTWG